jgi:hypothetical protein
MAAFTPRCRLTAKTPVAQVNFLRATTGLMRPALVLSRHSIEPPAVPLVPRWLPRFEFFGMKFCRAISAAALPTGTWWHRAHTATTHNDQIYGLGDLSIGPSSPASSNDTHPHVPTYREGVTATLDHQHLQRITTDPSFESPDQVLENAGTINGTLPLPSPVIINILSLPNSAESKRIGEQ